MYHSATSWRLWNATTEMLDHSAGYIHGRCQRVEMFINVHPHIHLDVVYLSGDRDEVFISGRVPREYEGSSAIGSVVRAIVQWFERAGVELSCVWVRAGVNDPCSMRAWSACDGFEHAVIGEDRVWERRRVDDPSAWPGRYVRGVVL
jgi:hypothetical protein